MSRSQLDIIALVAALAGACSAPPSPPAAERVTPADVTLATAAAADIAAPFEAGGVVQARATARLASRIMATIVDIRVRPGDRVRRGQTLVVLDGREIEANRQRASSSLASAVEGARAAGAEIQAADSALTLARATHDRIDALYAKRSATRQELDQAVAALRGAEAHRVAAEARAAAADSARTAARGAADAADVAASYAAIAAPFDGIVTDRLADPGSTATPGSPLLILEDHSMLQLVVQLDEARARFTRGGQVAGVRLDDAAEDAWMETRVAEIARVDPASHTFLVKIDLPEDRSLRSGFFGRARFAGPTRQTLTVPRSALVRRGQLTFVFILAASDHVVRLRPILTGDDDGDRVEVRAGLRAGDQIVTNPPVTLSDGARVSARAGAAK